MKTYARQIPPEMQQSPLWEFDFPDNIAVRGNKDFSEQLPVTVKRVIDVLMYGELYETIDDIQTGGYRSDAYKNITEAINVLLYPEKEKYSTRDIHKLKQLIVEYANAPCTMEDHILCEVLSVVTGKEWGHKTIRGCCQGEWNCAYYPVLEWTNKALKDFEVEYFNMGSDWIIDDEGFNPDEDSPENIRGYSVYSTADSADGIKIDIARVTGTNYEDVYLYVFDGYCQTARYMAIA